MPLHAYKMVVGGMIFKMRLFFFFCKFEVEINNICMKNIVIE